MRLNEVSAKLANMSYENKTKISKMNLFKLQALDFLIYLNSRKQDFGEDSHNELIVVKFASIPHYRKFGADYFSAISYILDIDGQLNEQNKYTDFKELFKNLNNTILPNLEELDRTTRPQYIYACFTDFLHDTKIDSDKSEYYEKNEIIKEIRDFSTKSNYATFYYFPGDTINYNKAIAELKNNKMIFSVFENLKEISKTSEWLHFENVIDEDEQYSKIDLGIRNTNEYIPIYYTSPFIKSDESKVKISFSKNPFISDFAISITSPTKEPLTGQYYYSLGSNPKQMIIPSFERDFSASSDVPIYLYFKGYVKDQIPSKFLQIRERKSGKTSRVNIIFVKDFEKWVKYIFFIATYIFLLLLVLITMYFHKNSLREILQSLTIRIAEWWRPRQMGKLLASILVASLMLWVLLLAL